MGTAFIIGVVILAVLLLPVMIGLKIQRNIRAKDPESEILKPLGQGDLGCAFGTVALLLVLMCCVYMLPSSGFFSFLPSDPETREWLLVAFIVGAVILMRFVLGPITSNRGGTRAKRQDGDTE